MRIFVEISRKASKKLDAMAHEARRNIRQQAGWLLERTIDAASEPQTEDVEKLEQSQRAVVTHG